jgi:hypothetical protein
MDEKKMDAELLPCPFCGKEPAPYHRGVGCVTTGCILNGLHLDYDKWQARASLPVGVPDGCIPVSIELLRHIWEHGNSEIRPTVTALLAAAPAAPAVKAEQVQCCCPKIGEDWNRATHGQDCPVHQPAPSLPAAASAGVEEVEVVGYQSADSGHVYGSGYGLERPLPLMTVAQHKRIVAQLAARDARQPALTVWEGAMPESNGKSNFTAVLMRKGAEIFDGISGGMTIARSEYPDRVRYEADCVRCLIGELKDEPCIIDYDADKHSGYKARDAGEVRVPRDVHLRNLGMLSSYVTLLASLDYPDNDEGDYQQRLNESKRAAVNSTIAELRALLSRNDGGA